MRVIIRFTRRSDEQSYSVITCGPSSTIEKTTNSDAVPATGDELVFRHGAEVLSGVVTSRVFAEEPLDAPAEVDDTRGTYSHLTCIVRVQETV